MCVGGGLACRYRQSSDCTSHESSCDLCANHCRRKPGIGDSHFCSRCAPRHTCNSSGQMADPAGSQIRPLRNGRPGHHSTSKSARCLFWPGTQLRSPRPERQLRLQHWRSALLMRGLVLLFVQLRPGVRGEVWSKERAQGACSSALLDVQRAMLRCV